MNDPYRAHIPAPPKAAEIDYVAQAQLTTRRARRLSIFAVSFSIFALLFNIVRLILKYKYGIQ